MLKSRPKSNVPSAKRGKFAPRSTVKLYRVPALVKMGRQGFPLRLQATLRYAQNVTLTIPAAGTTISQVFRCNGMYDPDFTGTGHQPFYFDQYMAIYDHFNVMRSTITCMASATSASAVHVGLMIDDDTTTIASPITGYERGGQLVTCNPFSDNIQTLRTVWNRDKAFGKVEPNMSQFRGDASADPTENQCFVYQLFQPDLAGGSYYCSFKIEYEVEFTELRDVAQS